MFALIPGDPKGRAQKGRDALAQLPGSPYQNEERGRQDRRVCGMVLDHIAGTLNTCPASPNS